MNEEERERLRVLIRRGDEIVRKVNELKGQGLESFIGVAGILGRLGSSRLEEGDRAAGEVVTEAAVKLLDSPFVRLKQEYTQWQIDCRIFFVQMGWMSHRPVRGFLEASSHQVSRETGVTVEMLALKQVEILKQIDLNPPRPWHVAKAGFVVVYFAASVFVDVVLFSIIGFAVVPLAAFQVAFLAALPRIEEWVRS